eukprot:GHVT01080860.1.p1 GENE.GHVT01080860.1~~GHVT01080860.1.p1  ORF type:complete len:360 (-),score=51.56 GHVT01080860.1:283-1362(-)
MFGRSRRTRLHSGGQDHLCAPAAIVILYGFIVVFAAIAIPVASDSEAAPPSTVPINSLDSVIVVESHSSGSAQPPLLQADQNVLLAAVSDPPEAAPAPPMVDQPCQQKDVAATLLSGSENSVKATDVKLQDSATATSTPSVAQEGLTVETDEKEIKPLAKSEGANHLLLTSTPLKMAPDVVESADHGPPHPMLLGDSPAAIVEKVAPTKKKCPVVFARKRLIAAPAPPPGFSANRDPRFIGVVRHADGIFLDWLRSMLDESQITVWDRRGLTAKKAAERKKKTPDTKDAAISDNKNVKNTEKQKANKCSKKETETPEDEDEANRKAKLFRARVGKGWTCANGKYGHPCYHVSASTTDDK